MAIALLKIQLSELEPVPFRVSSVSSSIFKNGCSELLIQIKMIFKLLGCISFHFKKFYFSWCLYFFPHFLFFSFLLFPFSPLFFCFNLLTTQADFGIWGMCLRLGDQAPLGISNSRSSRDKGSIGSPEDMCPDTSSHVLRDKEE